MSQRPWRTPNSRTGTTGGYAMWGQCGHKCDILLAQPAATKHGCVIVAKNADLPLQSVNEVLHVAQAHFGIGDMVECTYVSVPQVRRTNATVMSRTGGQWGCEMGANQFGLVAMTVALYSELRDYNDNSEHLLDVDLVRLALERCATSAEAVQCIGDLLEVHGQGGAMSEYSSTRGGSYDCGIVLADRSADCWVVETAGRHWAARRIDEPLFNLSNRQSIGADYTLLSARVKAACRQSNLWDGVEPFDWRRVVRKKMGIRETADTRADNAKSIMERCLSQGKLEPKDIASILSDSESGICCKHDFKMSMLTAASQMSVLPPAGNKCGPVHFFTGTPDPSLSVFKPAVLDAGGGMRPSDMLVCPRVDDDPAKRKPRFLWLPDRRHALYKAHQRRLVYADGGPAARAEALRRQALLQRRLFDEADAAVAQGDAGYGGDGRLLQRCVEEEMIIYSTDVPLADAHKL